MSSAQGPQYHGTRYKTGEEGRFRENTAGQTPLPTRGTMLSKPLPGGRSLEVRRTPSPADPQNPLNVSVVSRDDGDIMYEVAYGGVNAVIPTLDGVSLSDGPTGELGEGERFVYLKATYNLSVSNGFAYGGTLTSLEVVVLEAEESEPLGPKKPLLPEDPVDFYILLATFEDGRKTGQYITSNLNAAIRGVSDASGEAHLLVTRLA